MFWCITNLVFSVEKGYLVHLRLLGKLLKAAKKLKSFC